MTEPSAGWKAPGERYDIFSGRTYH